ncbi:ATP-dependent nuclease [Pseudomonas reactans]|uniref:ATP-dependent nuclease n=1 Tax=Pseudomonas reactans TaxID=117680 RepID=UPI0031B57379
MIIESFQLHSGRTPVNASEPIVATPVTVFVGPNNSGKSKLLSEISQFCNSGILPHYIILKNALIKRSTPEDALKIINEVLITNPSNPAPQGHDHINIRQKNGSATMPWASFFEAIKDPQTYQSIYCNHYLFHRTTILDGSNRINLCNPQCAGNLLEHSHNSFTILFKDDAKRKEVRRIIFEAFETYFVIDPTDMGTFKIRLSDIPPPSEEAERSLSADAFEFYGNAGLISEASDGVKAFTGIITELIAGDPKVLLVDEPEAFLHPSLASKLGMEMSRAASKSGKNVFVSTHSPAFVMGCIQSGTPINIIRLTYRDATATSRLLPSTELLELMRHPLLRSTGVLSGLFYEFVVVTESDADRAFYQEINERLLQFKPEWGIPNCLFIHAQNKQTIPTIIKPLRKLGIPAVAIVDVDVLKEGGKNWSNFLASANIPELAHNHMASARTAINTALNATKKNMKTDGGIYILPKDECEAAQNLLTQLNQYGVFTVPIGELESWLKPLCVSGHGPSWLIDMFERMGEDPKHPDYVKPSDTDVWEFMRDIKLWLTDPKRKGIAA